MRNGSTSTRYFTFQDKTVAFNQRNSLADAQLHLEHGGEDAQGSRYLTAAVSGLAQRQKRQPGALEAESIE